MRDMHVLIKQSAYAKIMAWTTLCDKEIGGLLEVVPDGDRNLRVTDAWLIPQEVTGASIDFQAGFFEEHIKSKGWWGKPMPYICMGIWHSHVNMKVFMSSTDEKELVEKYACRGYLLNLVFNKKAEICAQVNSFIGPEEFTKISDYTLVSIKPDVKVQVYDSELLAQCKLEMEANVKEKACVVMSAGEFTDHADPAYGHMYGSYKDWINDNDDYFKRKERLEGLTSDVPPLKKDNKKNNQIVAANAPAKSNTVPNGVVHEDVGKVVYTWDQKLNCLVKHDIKTGKHEYVR